MIGRNLTFNLKHQFSFLPDLRICKKKKNAANCGDHKKHSILPVFPYKMVNIGNCVIQFKKNKNLRTCIYQTLALNIKVNGLCERIRLAECKNVHLTHASSSSVCFFSLPRRRSFWGNKITFCYLCNLLAAIKWEKYQVCNSYLKEVLPQRV